MNNNIVIAQKYSDAAFSFADKKNITTNFLDDLQKMSKKISVEFAKNLSNPFISKKSILDSINWLCDNAKVSKNVKSFIKIISLNKRLHLIDKICQNFSNKLHEKNGLKKFQVFSCNVVQEKKKSDIEKILKKSFANNKVEVSYKIDKEILGGLLIKQNNLIIDSSLKTYLDKLEAHIIN